MLDNIPLFNGLSKTEIETVSRHTVARTFPAHATLIREGEQSDSLYIILYGQVKIFVSDQEGNEAILNIQGPGNFFGEMALLDDSPRSASVVTMEQTRVAIMTKADFKRCLTDHPEIAYALIRALTQRIRSLSASFRNIALLDVYGRIARTLISLATTIDKELVVDKKLTHQELASMVGASREMVSRILKDLANNGYIHVDRKRITLREKLTHEWYR